VRIVKKSGHTDILLEYEEVKRLCRPGYGADTCVWLAMGRDGFECLYYRGDAPNLLGETLRERWEKGLTVAKRNGCEEIRTVNV